ncbi:hypothetical protein NQZ68_000866 [Dissostichus eleginoides]|nr:hypothetical protein NQZ68_000866 [Dissostichus eleginoides]
MRGRQGEDVWRLGSAGDAQEPITGERSEPDAPPAAQFKALPPAVDPAVRKLGAGPRAKPQAGVELCSRWMCTPNTPVAWESERIKPQKKSSPRFTETERLHKGMRERDPDRDGYGKDQCSAFLVCLVAEPNTEISWTVG